MPYYIDAGSLGQELEVEVCYGYARGLPATYTDPAIPNEAYITNIHVIKYNFDIDLKEFSESEYDKLVDKIIEYENRRI